MTDGTLREQGIKTLICGALSPEMLNYGESIGLRIIHGIAGELKKSCRLIANGDWTSPNIGFPDAADNAGIRVPRGVPVKERMDSQAGRVWWLRNWSGREGFRQSFAGEVDSGPGRILCLPEMRIEKTSRTRNTMLTIPLSCVQLLNDQGIKACYGTSEPYTGSFCSFRLSDIAGNQDLVFPSEAGSDRSAHHLPRASWSERTRLKE